MKFNDRDESFVNFKLRKCGNGYVTCKDKSIGISSAVNSTRKLLIENGFSPKDISEKSAKMEGVTQTLNSGASLEQVMHLGRWACISTPNHYKINSVEYKKSIGKKIPV